MGWNARPEYISNEGWIADVYLSKVVKDKSGNDKELKLAFEVQWSPQTLFETEYRQQKYIKSGVRCCWFFKRLPYDEEWDKPSKDIPMFKIFQNDSNEMCVFFDNRTHSLYEFVISLLKGEVKYYPELYIPIGTKIDIDYFFYKTTCWKCGFTQFKYSVFKINYEAKCGYEFVLEEEQGQFRKPRYEEDIIKAAHVIACEEDINLAPVGLRYNPSVQKQVYTFYCAKCNAVSGDFYADKEQIISEEKFRVLKTISTDSLSKRGFEANHWCYKSNHEE